MMRMVQMTWRGDDELIGRVRREAARQGRSVNDYLTAVLDAATDPDLAGNEAAVLRERLARAGLLAPPGPVRERPPGDSVAQARRAAARGTKLSEVVESLR